MFSQRLVNHADVSAYFKKHMSYSRMIMDRYKHIRKYKNRFAGPLYIPIDNVEDIKTPLKEAVFVNTLYLDVTGVIPKRVGVKYEGLDEVVSRFPKKIKEVVNDIPEYLKGFFISESIKIPTLRNPVSFEFKNGTIYPVYLVGFGYSPQKLDPILVSKGDEEILKVWFVDMFIPLAIVYTYKIDRKKIRTEVVPVRTIFVGRYFMGTKLPLGVFGEHYAFLPVFVPKNADISNKVLLRLGTNSLVFYEGPNDRRVED